LEVNWLIRPSFWRDDLIRVFRELADSPQDHAARITVKVLGTRTLAQNDKLQATIRDIARQVEWHGQKLSVDDWRAMIVASYRKGQRAVPGIDGGFVVLGASSKDLSVTECSDVIEVAHAFGAEHGVIWSDPR
jgi:hypothetical protein